MSITDELRKEARGFGRYVKKFCSPDNQCSNVGIECDYEEASTRRCSGWTTTCRCQSKSGDTIE